jgi:uncharacterized membrane protein YphA (DoxX/SURF4 family)
MSPNLERAGLVLIAVAFIGLGVLQIANGELLAGRPMPWPESMPGNYPIAIITGVLLIAAGVAAAARKIPLLPLIAGVWILLWAASRNFYFILSHLDYGGTLTNTGKALTLGGAGLLIASVISPNKAGLLKYTVVIERIFIGFFFFASGIQHFLFAEFVKTLVPAWIPGNLFWTYFAGIALCAAGLGLLTGIKAQLAALLAGWMVFAWLLVLHIPRAMGTGGNLNEWTAVCEATAVSGILFVLARELRK